MLQPHFMYLSYWKKHAFYCHVNSLYSGSLEGSLVISELITLCCLGVIFDFALFYIANELSYHLQCKQAPDIHVK